MVKVTKSGIFFRPNSILIEHCEIYNVSFSKYSHFDLCVPCVQYKAQTIALEYSTSFR